MKNLFKTRIFSLLIAVCVFISAGAGSVVGTQNNNEIANIHTKSNNIIEAAYAAEAKMSLAGLGGDLLEFVGGDLSEFIVVEGGVPAINIDGKGFDTEGLTIEADIPFAIKFNFEIDTEGLAEGAFDVPYYMALPEDFSISGGLAGTKKPALDGSGKKYADFQVCGEQGAYYIRCDFSDYAKELLENNDFFLMEYSFSAFFSSDDFTTGGSNTIEFTIGTTTFSMNLTIKASANSAPKISKSGSAYDKSNDSISWEIVIEQGKSPAAIGSLSIKDVMNNLHEYKGDFAVNIDEVNYTATPSIAAGNFTYAFSGITELQEKTDWQKITVTYKSKPLDAAFNVSNSFQNQTLEEKSLINGVELFVNSESVRKTSDAVIIQPDWVSKELAGTTKVDDSFIIDWRVDFNKNGRSINAELKDSLPSMGDGAVHYYDVGSVKIAPASNPSAFIDSSLYTIVFNNDGINPTEMTIKFDGGSTNSINQAYILTYKTIVDITDAQYKNIGDAKNNISFEYWYGSGGTRYIHKRGAWHGLGYSVIAKSGGGYDPLSGNFTWHVTLNHNGATLKDAVVTDTLSAEQSFVEVKNLKIGGVAKDLNTAVNIGTDGTNPTITFTEDINGSVITFDVITHLEDYSKFTEGEISEYYNSVNLSAKGANDEIVSASASGINYIKPYLLEKEFVNYDHTTHIADWKITVNTSEIGLANAVVTDVISPTAGVSYVTNSGKINGSASINPSIDTATNTLTFNLGNINDKKIITYQTKIDNPAAFFAWDLTSADDNSKTISNTAKLNANTLTLNRFTAEASFTTAALLSKTSEQGGKDGTNGRDYITWTIPINPNGAELSIDSGGSMKTICDKLADALFLDQASIRFYMVSINADGSFTAETELTQIEGNSDYYSYTRSDNTFSFHLDKAITALGGSATDSYILEFGTDIINTADVSSMSFSNSIYFSGAENSGKSEENKINTNNINADAAGGTLGKVVITLVDTETGKAIEGGEFEIYDKYGNYISTVTTDANGKATFKKIRYNKEYEIRQVGTSGDYNYFLDTADFGAGGNITEGSGNGYKESDKYFSWKFKLDNGNTVNLSVKNTIMKGGVSVETLNIGFGTVNNFYTNLVAKFGNTGILANEFVADVIFKFTPANNGTVYYAKTVIDGNKLVKCDANGDNAATDALTDVTHGTVVTIQSVPDGFEKPAFSQTVNYDYNCTDTQPPADDGTKYTIQKLFNNATKDKVELKMQKADITFTKSDQYDGGSGDFSGYTNKLIGVSFELCNSSGDSFSPKITQNSITGGVVTFDDIIAGEYVIKETLTPAGYIDGYSGNIKAYGVKVTNGTSTGSVIGTYAALPAKWVNHLQLRGSLSINLYETGTTTTLSGAEFELYSDSSCTNKIGTITHSSGSYVFAPEATMPKNETYSLDYHNASGFLYGAYYIKQTETPEYYNSSENIKVVIKASANTATIYNEYESASLTLKSESQNTAGTYANAGDVEIKVECVNWNDSSSEFINGNTDRGTEFTAQTKTPNTSSGISINLPLGTYKISVPSVGAAYLPNEEVYYVSVYKDSNTVKIKELDATTGAGGADLSTLTFSVSRKLFNVNATVSASTGGTITSGANQTNILYGANASIIAAAPDTGYEITGIRINATTLTSGTTPTLAAVKTALLGGGYTLTNVTEDMTIEVTFSKLQFNISAGLTTVPSGAGVGGTITVSSGGTAEYGDDVTVAFVPKSDFHISGITINGTAITDNELTAMISAGEYTFTNITVAQSINITFERDTHTVTTSTVSENGSISIGTPLVYHDLSDTITGASSVCTITANTGYHIASVTINGVLESLTVDDTSPVSFTHTFKNVTSDCTIDAVFEINKYMIDTSVASGSGTITDDAMADYGSSKTITITPDQGQRVSSVKIDKIEKIGDCADNNGIKTYTFTNITSAHTVAVAFVPNTYSVTATEATRAPYENQNGGTVVLTPLTAIDHGGSASIVITPSTGYRIYSITDKIVTDGGDVSSSTNITSFTAEGYTYAISDISNNHKIDVVFEKISFTVSAAATGGSCSIVKTTNGEATSGKVYYGESCDITITLETGYHIESATDNGSDITLGTPVGEPKSLSYVLSDIKENHDIIIVLAKDLYNVSTNINDADLGTVTVAQTVKHGEPLKILLTPETGYRVSSLSYTIGGTEINADLTALQNEIGNSKSYTIPAAETLSHVAVSVSFERITLTVAVEVTDGKGSAIIGENGSIISKTIYYGENETITMTPEANCHIENVTVNGINLTSEQIADIESGGGSYDFLNIIDDIYVVVTFAIDQNQVVVINSTLTNSYSENGGVSSTSGYINYGENTTITFSANEHFHISTVKIDDVILDEDSTPKLSEVIAAGEYEFINVITERKFEIIYAVDVYTVTATADINGSVFVQLPEVEYNSDSTVNITPNAGYKIAKVIVDGQELSDTTSPTLQSVINDNIYTFREVSANHSLYAEFTVIDQPEETTTSTSTTGSTNIEPASTTSETTAPATITIHDLTVPSETLEEIDYQVEIEQLLNKIISNAEKNGTQINVITKIKDISMGEKNAFSITVPDWADIEDVVVFIDGEPANLSGNVFYIGELSASTIIEIVYVVNSPELSVPGGTYSRTFDLKIKTKTKGAVIHYTIDGSIPTSDSPIYSKPLRIEKYTNIKIIAVKDGHVDSEIIEVEYFFDEDGGIPPTGINIMFIPAAVSLGLMIAFKRRKK